MTPSRVDGRRAIRLVARLGLIVVIGALLLGASRLWSSAGQTLTRESIAHSLMAQGRPLDAAQLFDTPLMRGIAYHRARRFERAAEAFQQSDDIRAQYNRGVSLAHLDRIEDAIAAFNSVLAIDPGHVDAQHNLAVLRQIDRTRPQEEQGESSPDDQGAVRQRQTGGDESQMRSSTDPIEPDDQDAGKPEEKPPAQTDDADNTASLGGTSQSEPGERPRIDQQGGERSDSPSRADSAQDEQSSELDGMARTGEQGESESTMADTIRLRHLVDDPAVVLRARLKATAEARAARINP